MSSRLRQTSSSSEFTKDCINLVRLVDRLEAGYVPSSASEPTNLSTKRSLPRLKEISNLPAADRYWKTQSELSTVAYARSLQERLTQEAGPVLVSSRSGEVRDPQLSDIARRLALIESRIKELQLDLKPPEYGQAKRLRPDFLKPAEPTMPQLLPPPPVSVSPSATLKEASPFGDTTTPNRASLDQGLIHVEDAVPIPEADGPAGSTAVRRATLARNRKSSQYGRAESASTDGIDTLLSHHRELQDNLTEDLSTMARQLKLNTINFASVLEKDKNAISEAETKLEGNLGKMKQQSGKLGAYKKKGGTTTCFIIAAVALVAIAWFMIFAIIRITPK
ncbi:uncharacterized protein L969DRAFT_103318 [Mixia osmundae IAM 14324]|uniref:t-SNARE coiled-coil homology domain-containing protein n=1 Tax=Mixia osmundae (strain CBS 9802 / IAM 14324 / JCM 22182 / KY 12970) TaxID=764103 RepID=G7E3J6_MIXOS|nr:uncharacterized protein L969DRAFT_103318 [Mixia osmundae IAM 14324]KEI39391.1 hypothetical protein L969DRAFT_103318 [Mixia osmundae IAM 14324]GAA97406.1 hypothetical protein E5Q_04084 [Mixia osmundae IAM 14324]